MFNTRIGVLALMFFLLQAPALAEQKYVPFDMPYVGASYGRSMADECASFSGLPAVSPAVLTIPNIIDSQGEVTLERLPQTRINGCSDDKVYKIYGGVDFNLTSVPVLLGIEAGFIDMGNNDISGSVTGQHYQTDGSVLRNNVGDPVTYRYPISNGQHEVTSIYYGLRFGIRLFEDRLLLFGKGGFHSWENEFLFALGAGTTDDTTGLTSEQIAALPALPAIPERLALTRDFPELHTEGRDIFYGLGAQYTFPQDNGNVVGVRVDWDRFELNEWVIDESVDVYSLGVSYGFNIYK